MRISYFRVKNFKKSLLEVNIYFSEIGLYGFLKNPVFYAVFRSQGTIQKKSTEKKDNSEKIGF
jgi:hypothetical protein